MIARMWRGWVRSERIEEYVEIVERTGMDGYRATAGNRGAQLLTRDLGGGRTELVTLSWWDDLEVVRAFAGEDVETAKYYPEDDEFLLDRETTVAHFEVSAPEGFEVVRTVPGTRETIFGFFTEPARFAHWFVVPGHTTPPDRLALDPRPGGLASGVLVSDADGTEVPFAATYDAVEAPSSVTFGWPDPEEQVTLSVTTLDPGHCRVGYRHHGLADPSGLASSMLGAELMLEALVHSARATLSG